MLHIVLVEPEIPQNCGNIARTCAATGASLHLVRPLGFDISDRAVKRAGLDYWHLLDLTVYDGIEDFLSRHGNEPLVLATSKGSRPHTRMEYPEGAFLLFGKETAGLPDWLRERYPDSCVRIPMLPGVRCLNLSNAVAVLCYEALRQQGFPGLTPGSNLQ